MGGQSFSEVLANPDLRICDLGTALIAVYFRFDGQHISQDCPCRRSENPSNGLTAFVVGKMSPVKATIYAKVSWQKYTPPRWITTKQVSPWNTKVIRHTSTTHVHCRRANKWKHNGDRSKACPFLAHKCMEKHRARVHSKNDLHMFLHIDIDLNDHLMCLFQNSHMFMVEKNML